MKVYNIRKGESVTAEFLRSYFTRLYTLEIETINQVHHLDVFSSEICKAIDFFGGKLTKEEIRHYAGKYVFSQILSEFAEKFPESKNINFTFFGRDGDDMEKTLWSRIQFILVTFKLENSDHYGSAIFDAWTPTGCVITSDATKVTRECEIFNQNFNHSLKENLNKEKKRSATVVGFATKTIVLDRKAIFNKSGYLKTNSNHMNFFLVNDAKTVEVKAAGSKVVFYLYFDSEGKFEGYRHGIAEDNSPVPTENFSRNVELLSQPPPIYAGTLLPPQNSPPAGYDPNMANLVVGYDPNMANPVVGYDPNMANPVVGYDPNMANPVNRFYSPYYDPNNFPFGYVPVRENNLYVFSADVMNANFYNSYNNPTVIPPSLVIRQPRNEEKAEV